MNIPSIVPAHDDTVYIVEEDFDCWARDVSNEIAAELRRRSEMERAELTRSVALFVERHALPARQLTLRLA